MKDILRGIINGYSDTIVEVQNQDMATYKCNHKFMSSKFVLNAANKIKDIINGEDIHVFSRYVEKLKVVGLARLNHVFGRRNCYLQKLSNERI